MNKLLQRQIRKILGENYQLPEHCQPLLDLINETYNNFDTDRKMLENVLEKTSDEMIALHNKLKKESREALDIADERLKLATVAANVGIWELDLKTGAVIWNNITYSLYGLSTDIKMDGLKAWQQHVHPDDQEMAKKEMLLAIKGEKDFDIEYRVIWPDSSVHYLRTKGIVQFDEYGNKVKMVGTKWDVTDRIMAQFNLKREKELAYSMINSLPGIFFLFTYSGKLIKWNKNLMEVTGYDEEEIHDMHPLDFFDEDEKEKIAKEIELVLTNGHSNTEANLFTKSGKKIPYYFNSIIINYEGNNCVIGTAINIEERKKAEENLKAKNKDLEEFAYMVSHNLRAPIAKIQGLAALVNTDDNENKEDLNLLKYIKDEVFNLDLIIKEMNAIIREREYVNFKTLKPKKKTLSAKVVNVYLIDDDPIVNVISKKTIEKAGFAEKINVHQNALKCLEDLKTLSELRMHDFPEIIFLDINMPGMNGWEFLDEFKNLSDSAKSKCKIFMLTSSIDPNDIKRSQTYSTVKDFITKPLTKEKLDKLLL